MDHREERLKLAHEIEQKRCDIFRVYIQAVDEYGMRTGKEENGKESIRMTQVLQSHRETFWKALAGLKQIR